MLPSALVLARRLTDLRTSLAAQGLGALVVTHQPNLRYLVNHVGSAGLAVVTHGGVELLVDARYTEAVRAPTDA
jgi:Xaa-Pro aminopeptidase